MGPATGARTGASAASPCLPSARACWPWPSSGPSGSDGSPGLWPPGLHCLPLHTSSTSAYAGSALDVKPRSRLRDASTSTTTAGTTAGAGAVADHLCPDPLRFRNGGYRGSLLRALSPESFDAGRWQRPSAVLSNSNLPRQRHPSPSRSPGQSLAAQPGARTSPLSLVHVPYPAVAR